MTSVGGLAYLLIEARTSCLCLRSCSRRAWGNIVEWVGPLGLAISVELHWRKLTRAQAIVHQLRAHIVHLCAAASKRRLHDLLDRLLQQRVAPPGR